MNYSVALDLIKVEEKGIHLLIDVAVNHKSARFIVDTGASQTVMDKEQATNFIGRSGILESESLSKGLGTDSMQSFTTELESLEIGDLKIEKQGIVLLDLSHVVNSYVDMGHPPIDGVIGGDILSNFKAVIDYGSETINFTV